MYTVTEVSLQTVTDVSLLSERGRELEELLCRGHLELHHPTRTARHTCCPLVLCRSKPYVSVGCACARARARARTHTHTCVAKQSMRTRYASHSRQCERQNTDIHTCAAKHRRRAGLLPAKLRTVCSTSLVSHVFSRQHRSNISMADAAPPGSCVYASASA